MIEKVVVAGSGPAGCTAALYAARAGLAPLVLEGLEPGGQLTTTTEVENFPGFPKGIKGPELMDLMKCQAERFGARFQFGSIQSADFTKQPYRLALDDERLVDAHALIIATGASARYLGLPSEQALRGRGVSACATCDGSFFKGMAVAVVGGGDTAMEDALYLTRFATHVYLIHRRKEFRASQIMIDRALANPKIEAIVDTVVDEVLDPAARIVNGLRLRHLPTGKTRLLPMEGLFVAIGHEPNTLPFRSALAVNEAGYLVTRGVLTDLPGVYAAGDVRDPVYRQAVAAAGDGCMAALEAVRFLERAGL